MKIKPSSKPFNFSLGDRGEVIAAAYLSEKGYKILDQKLRLTFGELDIVAEKNGVIIFIEVKTRSGARFGAPEEAVDERKQKQLSLLALKYLQKKNAVFQKARFDVVALDYDGRNEPQIRHYENAFELSE